MATYLLCSTPVHGHVSPMIAIGRDLVARGNRVVMLTGARFADRVTGAGMEFAGLSGTAEFDDRDADAYLPDRHLHRGLALAQYDIQTIFVKTIPDQARSVEALLEVVRPDAILVDGAFAGVTPLLQRADRPPILAVGVTPLTQSSVDVAPAGMALPPARGAAGRLRNRVLHRLAKTVLFRQTQELGTRMIAEAGGDLGDLFIMDVSAAFDRFLHLSSPGMEYPRRDMAPNTVLIGPLPAADTDAPLPAWWDDLDDGRPVIHVTQGTIDNRDLDRLIRPTLVALADLDAHVVVSLGGRPAEDLGEVPRNVRVASYLPYEKLLQRTDVFVTNGGFGGVQQALSHGVPIVIAGDTEDKPEVAARVGWSGVGVNLRTGSPSPAAIRRAVDTILGDTTHRAAAEAEAMRIADLHPFDTIAEELAQATRR